MCWMAARKSTGLYGDYDRGLELKEHKTFMCPISKYTSSDMIRRDDSSADRSTQVLGQSHMEPCDRLLKFHFQAGSADSAELLDSEKMRALDSSKPDIQTPAFNI
ncbi:hypothetical protein N7474_007515 [Penicillium riverlandense]|uniref:uncharacterized protein n=1 Tax=Penicillium riverlandense TaxID=1903569 RepID=UPI00254823FC|nr:uncharacterized protein N7474_007515 [Penicillium riverlandense]KAJ5815738.1 hypothetical protein N7474_007515 [Penicillium riverlandense]